MQDIPVAAEPAAESDTAEMDTNIFTLEERGAGWDDVRQGITAAKNDRSKAVGDLASWSDRNLGPALRWSKVLAKEVAGAVSSSASSKAEGGVEPVPTAPLLAPVPQPSVPPPRPPSPPPPPPVAKTKPVAEAKPDAEATTDSLKQTEVAP